MQTCSYALSRLLGLIGLWFDLVCLLFFSHSELLEGEESGVREARWDFTAIRISTKQFGEKTHYGICSFQRNNDI